MVGCHIIRIFGKPPVRHGDLNLENDFGFRIIDCKRIHEAVDDGEVKFVFSFPYVVHTDTDADYFTISLFGFFQHPGVGNFAVTVIVDRGIFFAVDDEVCPAAGSLDTGGGKFF